MTAASVPTGTKRRCEIQGQERQQDNPAEPVSYTHLDVYKRQEIDIEIEKERELKPGRAAPAAYGRYKNVILTDTELSELKAELPDKWEYYIDRLSGRCV